MPAVRDAGEEPRRTDGTNAEGFVAGASEELEDARVVFEGVANRDALRAQRGGEQRKANGGGAESPQVWGSAGTRSCSTRALTFSIATTPSAAQSRMSGTSGA